MSNVGYIHLCVNVLGPQVNFGYLLLWFSTLFFCSFVCLFFVFRDRVPLYSPGCPGTHFVDQAGLELKNPPASASQVLGLKACATAARLFYFEIGSCFVAQNGLCLFILLPQLISAEITSVVFHQAQ